MVMNLGRIPVALDATEQVRQSFILWLNEQDNQRHERYRVYREYYDGDHDTQLTDRMRRFLQLKLGQEFNDNLCPIPVDALAEKLSVTGFDAGDAQSEQVWNWWQVNRMDLMQEIVHLAAVRDGDTYVLVEWDQEQEIPRFSYEPAYSDGDGCEIFYSKERRHVPEFGWKRWRVEKGPDTGYTRRLNVYHPDRIEKYISDQRSDDGGWAPYEEEGEPWPLPWVGTDGQPLGVPLFHFKNADQGYSYGQSELRSVIPLQNALNKSIIDLLASADLTGFRIYVVEGGEPGSLEIVPGTWISTKPTGNGDVIPKVKAIDGADLSPLIALKDSFAMDIARVSRTPLTYFQTSGHRPAEGTLKQEETGLVAKARKRQRGFGNTWEDVMSMARRLHNTYNNAAALDMEQLIEAQWADPETRNEKAHLETLKIKSDLGVPSERLWREMGYDADDIAEMRAQVGEEMTQTSNAGGELLRAFERGEM